MVNIAYLSTGVFSGFRFPWEKPTKQLIAETQIAPTGAVTSGITNIGKYLIIGGVGAVAGATILGSKQALEQRTSQQAQATNPTYYQFYQTKGGGSQIVQEPTGATSSIDQTAKQQAEQTQTDMTSLLILGIIAIGGLMLFSKKK